jgi:hypothetical protein
MKGGAVKDEIETILRNMVIIHNKIVEVCGGYDRLASASQAEALAQPCMAAYNRINNAIRVMQGLEGQATFDDTVTASITQINEEVNKIVNDDAIFQTVTGDPTFSAKMQPEYGAIFNKIMELVDGLPDVLPIAAAVTVVSTPVAVEEGSMTVETSPATVKTAPLTNASGVAAVKEKTLTPPQRNTKPPGKPIRFILFGEEFNDFSTASNESSKKILTLLGEIKEDKQAVLQQIYDGIIHLRKPDVLTTYPLFKRLLANMGLTYAKQKNELKEEIIRPELTEIQLAFPNDTDVTVTLTIKCDQMPSCSKNNLALAAAATVVVQTGGEGKETTARTIRLFGKDYQFLTSPKDINDHLELLKELEVEDKDATFKLTLLEEIYDGCYTDGSIISKIKCSTFGTLLEELGQKYVTKMRDLLVNGATSIRSNQKEKSTSRKELSNGDIELTFTFSNFGKQLDAETQKKISEAVQKLTKSQSFGSKLKHMVSTVSSDQVSIHGMDNQKNACFCISALQFLFSIPQIRTAIKKHGCDSKVFEQILTQIHDPHYEMTEVNQDGIMCALFHLFEELGEDMALFSKLTADFKAGAGVPYDLLGYIMKNYFIHIGEPKAFGQQQAARDFIAFLFEVFNEKKISVTNLFEFTIDSARDGSSTKENALFWPLQLERDGSGNLIRVSLGDKTRPKQQFGTTLTRQEEINGANREVTDTIELKTNPYLLIQTSIKSMDTGELRYTNAGELNRNASGKPIREMGERFDNVDLTAIPHVFNVGNKTFKHFGSIQYEGSGTGGHYIYTRRDLSSTKGIVYNDATLTFYPDIATAPNPFPDYVMIYAEMGQEEKEKHFEEEAQKMEDLIRDKTSASIDLMTKDINKSGGVDNNLNMHMLDFIQEGYMTGLDKKGNLSGGGNKEGIWKARLPVGDLLFFKEDAPTTDVKTKKNLSIADLCLMLKEYAQKTRIRESIKSTSMDILSSEMDKAKDVYLESTDDAIKKNALVAYAIFDILKELMEGIIPISKEDLKAKSAEETAIQKNIAEKRIAKEKEAKAEVFKRKHPFLIDAPPDNTTVPTAVAAAAAAMSNESDATSEEVLSAKSETSEEVESEEDQQGQLAANDLASLSTSPNSKLAANKQEAASLLVSMRTLSDEIKQLKKEPKQNSDKIREKIYELTAMRSNVNEIQGINKSNSTNAAKILKEAINTTHAVDSTSSSSANAANANRNENRPPVIESKERQTSALPSENENSYNEYKNNNSVNNNPTEYVELKNLSSDKKSAQSLNLASSASFVNKTRKSGQAVTAALEQERKEKEERKARYQANREQREAEQREAAQVEKKATSSISDKITDSLRIAQTLKDKPINDPAVNKIKTDFKINISEMDKSNIMDKILESVGRWMEAIDRTTKDKSDPTYVSTYLDYIALLVTKSMIDALMGDKPIPNESAESIAKRLIDNYSKMKNPKKLPIEQMAEHIIEQKYYKQLKAESNQLQAANSRVQIQKAEEAKVLQQAANKKINVIDEEINTLTETYTELELELKNKMGKNHPMRESKTKTLYETEKELIDNYLKQMYILKDAIKDTQDNTEVSGDLYGELEVILGKIQGIFVKDKDFKKKNYKDTYLTELESYKEGEVLRKKARYDIGLETSRPVGSSKNLGKELARAMVPNLYPKAGGRRTLRAAKKKRTLRAAKKRTLRASKKLRRSTASK